MAKKKDSDALAQQVEVAGVEAGQPVRLRLNPIMAKLVQNQQKEFGTKNVQVGKNVPHYGIEPYFLGFLWMFDCDIIPFGIGRLVGDPKTYKSTLAYALLREVAEMKVYHEGLRLKDARPDYRGPDPEQEFRDAGFVSMTNTEGKLSYSKLRGVMGPYYEVLPVNFANTHEEWQRIETSAIKALTEACDKREAAVTKKGKLTPSEQESADTVICPVMRLVDSVTGTRTEAIQEQVEAEGSMGRGFDDASMLNARWFGTQGSNFRGYPFYFLGVCHQSIEIDGAKKMPGQAPGKKALGGDKYTYQLSYEIGTRTGGYMQPEVVTSSETATLVRWEVRLNSLGESGRSLSIGVEEHPVENPDTGAIEYSGEFQWDRALTNLIFMWKNDKDATYKANYTRLEELFGGPIVGGIVSGKKAVWCEAIGAEKELGMTAAEFGKFIQTNPELREKVKRAMLVSRGAHWTPHALVGQAIEDVVMPKDKKSKKGEAADVE